MRGLKGAWSSSADANSSQLSQSRDDIAHFENHCCMKNTLKNGDSSRLLVSVESFSKIRKKGVVHLYILFCIIEKFTERGKAKIGWKPIYFSFLLMVITREQPVNSFWKNQTKFSQEVIYEGRTSLHLFVRFPTHVYLELCVTVRIPWL